VRRALASRYQGSWDDLARQAEDDSETDHGLAPWWIAPGAVVRRHVVEMPLSERKERLRRLKRRRVLYRLALGQPDQEDLVDELERALAGRDVADWALELSPWFAGRSRHG